MQEPAKITLSPAQLEVVHTRGCHVQVIACAGSGKTESVSRRVAALIGEGVKSDEIVAFTFTDRAATELKERIVKRVAELVGEDAAGRLAQMYVGTIHGYCLRLLQNHLPEYGNCDVVDEHRHAALLFRFRTEIGLKLLAPKVWEAVHEFARTADVISNECLPIEAIDGTDFGPMYRKYLAILGRLHLLTYARIVQCAVEALEDPSTRARIVAPLKHLIVDEYQDINPSQDRLIRHLASHGAEVCVVGDDDQAIYQWRGSNVDYIQRFGERFGGARQVILNENRRSVAPIVHRADGFAQSLLVRIAKLMKPTRLHDGPAIIPFRTEYAEDEAAAVADSVLALRDKGVPYRDIAVLFRSVRTSTKPFIDAFRARSIPLTCGGRSGLFLQPEVQAAVKAHLWLGGMGWYDPELEIEVELAPEGVAEELKAAFRSAQPVDEIAGLLDDWASYIKKSKVSANLIDDLYRLFEFLGVNEWDPDDAETLPRMGALARLSTILADFEHVTRRGRYELNEAGEREFKGGSDRGPEYYQRLGGYLRYYAQDAYEEFEGEDGTGVDAVQFMTVHGAKGLEWPVVFLPALQDRRFPASRAGRVAKWTLPDDVLAPAIKERYAGGEEEERRLFYVAMTRARDALYVSHFERTERMASKRSRFVDTIYALQLPEWAGPELPDEITARAATAPAKPVSISLTELIRYEDCGYRFRLQRSIGFESQLVAELGFGRAIHHVLRRVAEEARELKRIPDLNRVNEILDAELYFPFANRSSEPLMKQKARNLVTRYLNNHRDDFERVWATERPFELHLPQGFLSGRADVILDREGGRPDSLAIVDYKSGTDSASDENFRFQLQVYAAAARSEGLDVKAAYLHDLSAQQAPRTAIGISPEECGKAIERVAGLFGGMARREFDAKAAAEKCGRCEFQRICSSRA
jgi:DNA helicase-2/ATP-dependent DNA helicase PcrA